MEPNRTTDTQEAIRAGRDHLLPQMREYQCPLVWSQAQAPPHTHDRGTIHRGSALHDGPESSGRLSHDLGAQSDDVRGDNGTLGDSLPGDLDSLSPCCRYAYRVGRYEAIQELAEKMRKQ